MSYFVGVDIGISATKLAAYDRQKEEFTDLFRIKASDQTAAAYGVIGKFLSEKGISPQSIEQIIVSGAGSYKITDNILGIPTKHENEFTAIAKGGLALSGKDRAIIVSIGTGTALVRADQNGITHLGGTGVGGGTLMGLCRNIFNINQFDEIIKLAEQGNLAKVNLRIGDISEKVFDTLVDDITAANFGKFNSNADREDIILGFINMIFETIGMMVVFACKNDDIKTAVLTGGMTVIPQTDKMFDLFNQFMDVEFIVPENALFAPAMGAVLAHLEEK